MQISKEEKLAQLEKILQARAFQGSESLRAFLRFVVDKAIEEQQAHLKEYVIATEVLGRGDNFDSRVDSVVRVQAGRLRTKLHEYYSDEGKDDAVIIDLPKGHYVPVFSYASQETRSSAEETRNGNNALPSNLPFNAATGVAVALTPALHTQEAGSPPATEKSGLPGVLFERVYLWQILAGLSGSLALFLGVMAYHYHKQAVQLPVAFSASVAGDVETLDRQVIEPLWGDFLRSSEPILVVYSNTLFQGNAEDGMKLLKSLESPGSSVGSPIIPQSEIEQSRQPVTEHYTGIGEVMGAYFLGDFFARASHTSRVKRSLLLTWEDLKTENIVVLGSPAENLFLRDLPQKQELIFKPMEEEKGKKSFGVLNTKPKTGELGRYFAKQDGPSRSQIIEDYAVISLLKGLDEKKQILILAGITTLGTQAAAEYVTKPDYIRDLISHLNTAPPQELPKLPSSFQILVKVKVNGGVPVQISYVTHNVL
jgi:hypothetical protein